MVGGFNVSRPVWSRSSVMAASERIAIGSRPGQFYRASRPLRIEVKRCFVSAKAIEDFDLDQGGNDGFGL
jgi:hypothetical protein